MVGPLTIYLDKTMVLGRVTTYLESTTEKRWTTYEASVLILFHESYVPVNVYFCIEETHQMRYRSRDCSF